jgi:hypothetical protein
VICCQETLGSSIWTFELRKVIELTKNSAVINICFCRQNAKVTQCNTGVLRDLVNSNDCYIASYKLALYNACHDTCGRKKSARSKACTTCSHSNKSPTKSLHEHPESRKILGSIGLKRHRYWCKKRHRYWCKKRHRYWCKNKMFRTTEPWSRLPCNKQALVQCSAKLWQNDAILGYVLVAKRHLFLIPFSFDTVCKLSITLSTGGIKTGNLNH